MSPIERMRFRPHELSIPDSGTGVSSSGKIEPETLQQATALPNPNTDIHLSVGARTPDPQDSRTDLSKAKREKWKETGRVSPIAGGAQNEPAGSEERNGELARLGNQPNSIDCDSTYLDMKGIDWRGDLSTSGQWLFNELLIGAEDIRLLEEYARVEGIDIDKATKELDQYNLIDRTDSGFFHLPWKKVRTEK